MIDPRLGARLMARRCRCVGCTISDDYYSPVAQQTHNDRLLAQQRKRVDENTKWNLFVEDFTLWARRQR